MKAPEINSHKITQSVLALPIVAEWTQMKKLWVESTGKIRPSWLLPVHAASGFGPLPEIVWPVVASVGCMQLSIILIDDMLDSDPRGLHNTIGAPAASNMAIAFTAVSLELATGAAVDWSCHWVNCLSKMALKTAMGQNADVSLPFGEEEYWQIVRTKSTPFYEYGFALGALAAAAPDDAVDGIREFGIIFGEMVQIVDDLVDIMAVPASADWLLSRNNLLLLYGKLAEYDEKVRFLELCSQVRDEHALTEAQQILIDAGAVAYVWHEMEGRYKRAEAILDGIEHLPDKRPLRQLIDQQVGIFHKLAQQPPS